MNETEMNFGKVGIGEDKPQIEAKTVVVKNYKVATVEKDGKEIGKKVVFEVIHPDIKERNIEISGAKFEQGDKVKISGLWWKLDTDGKIPYSSALGHVLRHYKKNTLEDMKGEQLTTIADESNYLIIRAY